MSSRLHNILPYLGVVLGIVVLASPFIAHLVETWRSDSAISEVVATVEQIPAADKAELLQQAQAYNEQLAVKAAADEELEAGESDDGLPTASDVGEESPAANEDADQSSAANEASDGIWPYPLQLSWRTSQVMSWIEIPRIDVRLAIYHGTGDNALMAGVGHLDNTSLPVGGESSHCVLSAHSGLPTARMFDDIHDLVPGDVFVIWTLGEPFAYRVTGIETVEPDDLSSLTIEQGQDLCTLVTCTPIGVNSQRLLVHAERCAYEEVAQEEAPVMYQSPRTLPLVAGLAIAGVILALASLFALRRR